jgi:hypothetical protein
MIASHWSIVSCSIEDGVPSEQGAAEVDADERVGAAMRHLPRHLLQQGSREHAAQDDHLPARLDVDARLDEELRVPLDALIGHGTNHLPSGSL